VAAVSLSLSDLSPLNPPSEDHLLVILKSYFDCSNQADSSEYDHICVGTVCGTGKQWKRFDTDWNKALYKHHAEYLHTTDAVSLQNDFCIEKEWTNKRVDAFIGSCVDVIGRHMTVPRGIPGRMPRPGLCPITLTIPFEDWLKAKKTVPNLPDTIEELCATESVNFAFKWGRYIGSKKYELFFDQGERLYGHINTRWRHPKAKRDIPIMEDVVHVGESVSKYVPALQMADLFAWCISHNDSVSRQWHRKLYGFAWHSALLDYAHLINPIPEALEKVASWGLSPRKSSVANLSKPKRVRASKG
jgi:hypothetical protein